MRTSVTKRKGRGGITLGLIVIGLLLVFGILISNILPSNSTPVVNGEIDTSRYVKLSMFLIGPSSTEAIIGYQDMVAQLNGDLKENINANVEVTFVPLDQVDREYLLAFNSKEAYDVIYTSADAHPSYFGLVEEDAFKDLDDILPIYAKNIWENINPDSWDDARYKGKVYGIPLGQGQYMANGYIYSEDKLKEYELEPIQSIEDMENYIDTLLEKEFALAPLAMNEEESINLYHMMVDLNSAWVPAPGLPLSSAYLVSRSKDNRSDILHPAFTSEFVEFAERMKVWADKGYWDQDVLMMDGKLVDKERPEEHYSLFGDLNPYLHNGSQLSNTINWTDEGLGLFCFAGEKQKLIKKSAANNLLSINSESDKSERALMMLDYIMNDRDFYDFLDYGIQGEIVDYPNLDKELDYFESISIKDPYANFAFNPSPVEKEIENVIRVNSQYGPPILLGKAGSPKAAVDKYRLELSTAGIESIIEAVKEQLKDF